MQTWSRAAGDLGTSIPQPGAWRCGSWLCQVGFSPSQAPQGWDVVELWEKHPQRPGCCWSCLAIFTAYSFGFNPSLFSPGNIHPNQASKTENRGAKHSKPSHSTPKVQMYLPCLEKGCKTHCREARNRGREWKILTHGIRDEEVVAQEAVVQHGGDEPLQPSVAPVGAQGAHLDKQREVTGSAETTQTLQGA